MTPDLNQYVGQRTLRRRRLLGLTQRELAEKMGITAQQIHKYEQGASQITMQRLGQLCAALEVSVSYFVDGFGVTRERSGRENDDPHHRI